MEAILIPGGGLLPTGRLPGWVIVRLDLALELAEAGENWAALICLSAGSVHKPPLLDHRGYPIFESLAGARYLISRGADPQRVMVETCSYDTIGNAYFSRLIHADPAGWQRLAVVTSQFHLDRTRAAFNWIYGLDGGLERYELAYHATPDVGLSSQGLAGRQEREAESLAGLNRLTGRLTSLKSVHHWLMTEHEAYAAGLEPERAGGAVLESY